MPAQSPTPAAADSGEDTLDLEGDNPFAAPTSHGPSAATLDGEANTAVLPEVRLVFAHLDA